MSNEKDEKYERDLERQYERGEKDGREGDYNKPNDKFFSGYSDKEMDENKSYDQGWNKGYKNG